MAASANIGTQKGKLFARLRRNVGAAVQIVLLGVGASVTYGILQDQVTAHVCVEYFTIGHLDFLSLGDPTLIAFEWGLIATWWAGLLLGVPVALVARLGPRPPLAARDLLRPTLLILGGVGGVALVAGVAGYLAARAGAVSLTEPLASAVPQAKHVAFLTDLWAHDVAYAAGVLGGMALCVWTWRTRGALQQAQRGLPSQEAAFVSTTGSAPIRTEHMPRQWEVITLRVLLLVGGLSLGLGRLVYSHH